MTDKTTQLLERHFETAFDAPDGIEKLRELILTLAMEGKLVEQDPNEPSAQELLKEVESEKMRLIKEKKIKEPKPTPIIELKEIPYKLPLNWEWVRLSAIGEINPRNTCDDDKEVGFVPMPLIFSDYRREHLFETRLWGEIKKGYTHFANGDIGLAKITPCFENAKSCIFRDLPNDIGAGTTELHIYRNTFNAIYPEYLLAYLKNPKYITIGIPKMTGSAGQKRVPKIFFSHHPFPLPPLPEQHRIVAKIDQLMARCDELENLRAERDRKRLTVHTAALNRLLTSQSSDTFTDAWQFIVQHFGELYSVKDNVAELRKAILQLAVMGKLVEQDPGDEPASELLEEIEAEKQRLFKDGKIKKSKRLQQVKIEDIPYSIPAGWKWIRLGEAGAFERGRSKHRPRNDKCLFADGIYPFVQTGDVSRAKSTNDLITTCGKYYNDFGLQQSRLWPEGTLCITIAANIAETGFLGMEACMPDSVVAFLSLNNSISKFVKIFIDVAKEDLENYAPSTAQKNINLGIINELVFPLPPLPEQHRIVAKVDQLMTLCDTLEHQIDNATHKQTALLNVVMAQM